MTDREELSMSFLNHRTSGGRCEKFFSTLSLTKTVKEGNTFWDITLCLISILWKFPYLRKQTFSLIGHIFILNIMYIV